MPFGVLACPINMPLGVSRLPFEHAVVVLTRQYQPLATACPLNLPLASGNLKRWFHSNVYDRSIARSLSTKIAEWKDLFLNEEGTSKPVPAWEGLGPDKTFVADQSVLTGHLRTIREIDEAITRRCFGFDTVDDYYSHASSDQRLHLIDVPCMMINAVYQRKKNTSAQKKTLEHKAPAPYRRAMHDDRRGISKKKSTGTRKKTLVHKAEPLVSSLVK
jgi:hypothetical protein